MKKLLFLLLFASTALGQSIDSVLTTDTPNQGRRKWNANDYLFLDTITAIRNRTTNLVHGTGNATTWKYIPFWESADSISYYSLYYSVALDRLYLHGTLWQSPAFVLRNDNDSGYVQLSDDGNLYFYDKNAGIRSLSALVSGGSSSGEANVGANLAGAGIGVYKSKVDTTLNFKRLKAVASQGITITDGTDSVLFVADSTSWIGTDYETGLRLLRSAFDDSLNRNHSVTGKWTFSDSIRIVGSTSQNPKLFIINDNDTAYVQLNEDGMMYLYDDSVGAVSLASLVAAAGAGDITEVIAGTGLQGGGATGAVTLDLNPKATGGLKITSDSIEVDSTKFPATDYDVSLKLAKSNFGDSLNNPHTVTSQWFFSTTPPNLPITMTGTARLAGGMISATASDTVGLASALAAKMALSVFDDSLDAAQTINGAWLFGSTVQSTGVGKVIADSIKPGHAGAGDMMKADFDDSLNNVHYIDNFWTFKDSVRIVGSTNQGPLLFIINDNDTAYFKLSETGNLTLYDDNTGAKTLNELLSWSDTTGANRVMTATATASQIVDSSLTIETGTGNSVALISAGGDSIYRGGDAIVWDTDSSYIPYMSDSDTTGNLKVGYGLTLTGDSLFYSGTAGSADSLSHLYNDTTGRLQAGTNKVVVSNGDSGKYFPLYVPTMDTAKLATADSNEYMVSVSGGKIVIANVTKSDTTAIRNYSNSLYLKNADSTTLKNSLLKNADSTTIRNYSNSIYLKNADSTTLKNSLLKNADSTTIRNYSNSLYLKNADSTTLKNSLLKNADSTSIRNYSNRLYDRKSDTLELVVLGAGAGNASDTIAFSTTAKYGSFYHKGSDTLVITSMVAVMAGDAGDTLTIDVVWDDTLGGVVRTELNSSPFPVNSLTIGNEDTAFDNTKIPPGNHVWLESPGVVAGKKPQFLSVTLSGYRIRQ